MKRSLLAIAAAIACAAFLHAQPTTNPTPPQADTNSDQVDRGEVTRWGDTVQHIAGDERQAAAVGDVMGLPPDDNHKWFISVLGSKGCPACARLRADIRADQAAQKHLGAFITLMDGDEMHSDTKTSWSHYNYFYADDRTQQFRFEAVKPKGFPTIIVQPPLNKKYGDPATIVFKREGYDGDPDKLVKQISAAIKLYVEKLRDRQAGGPFKATLPPPPRETLPPEFWTRQNRWPSAFGTRPANVFGQIGVDPPWQPAPKVDPTPAPNVLPPTIPPPDAKPDAKPDKKPITPAEDAPPEAVILVDKNAPCSAEQSQRLANLVAKLRADGRILRVRQVDYRDAPELDVSPAELPAVVVTAEGRIIDRLTDRVLPLVTPDDAAPRQIGLEDVPWSVVWTLLTGGGLGVGGAIALGIFAIKAWRAFRQARGQAVLLSDEQIAALLARLAAFAEANKPAEPAK